MATGQCSYCNQRVDVSGQVADKHDCSDYEVCPGSSSPVDRDSLQPRVSTKLPPWVTAAISEVAYDHGHAHGQPEVVALAEDMIYVFERQLDNA